MVRARSHAAAVHVTVPGVIEPGAELVVKNESDQPIRAIADPHETLTLKTRERPTDERCRCAAPRATSIFFRWQLRQQMRPVASDDAAYFVIHGAHVVGS